MNLQRARKINAHYGDNYGAHKAPNHPEWTEIAGDRASRIRANYPTLKKEAYWRSKQYNQFANNLLTTGALNRPIKKGDGKVRIGAFEEQNPPRNLIQNVELEPKCVDAPSGSSTPETYMLGFLVVFMGVVFLITLNSNSN